MAPCHGHEEKSDEVPFECDGITRRLSARGTYHDDEGALAVAKVSRADSEDGFGASVERSEGTVGALPSGNHTL